MKLNIYGNITMSWCREVRLTETDTVVLTVGVVRRRVVVIAMKRRLIPSSSTGQSKRCLVKSYPGQLVPRYDLTDGYELICNRPNVSVVLCIQRKYLTQLRKRL